MSHILTDGISAVNFSGVANPRCLSVLRRALALGPGHVETGAALSRVLVVSFLVACGTIGCAGRNARPRLPAPPPPAASAAAIVDSARALETVPYRNGGADRSGFDCSGLVQYVFAQHGIALPRSVREQYDGGDHVGRDELKPGDLVFFSTVARGPSHVGIVVKDDVFVHAPSGGGVVREDRLNASYWATRYLGARRYW